MKRGRILIILGIILGLITFAGAFFILQQGTGQQAATPTPVPMQKVLVAIQNIAQADSIDPALVEEREFEKTQVPPDAVLAKVDLAGKLAAQDIYQGQIIRRDMLTDKATIVDKGVHASFLIPPGKVAIAFPITELSSVAYALQAGDTVDMLITVQLVSVDPNTQIKEPVMRAAPGGPASAVPAEGQIVGTQIPRMVTQLTVQDVQVLKVGRWNQQPAASVLPQGAPTPAAQPAGQPAQATPTPQAGQTSHQGQANVVPPGPTIITLLVDQQDALVLKFAREVGASIDFVLRSRNDHDLVTTEPVTLEYMMRRFNITPPEKLPYAVEMGDLAAPKTTAGSSGQP
jgi:Flp pilus assembly protein CpaB